MSEPPVVGLEEARSVLGEIVNRAHFAGEPTVITRHRKPAAVVISFDDYERAMAALNSQGTTP